MKIREIKDDNSLVEVYIHWLLDNGHEVDKIGYIKDLKDLGIYYCWHKDTNKYCVIATDYDYYIDKRVKKPLTKYKRSICFFYTIEDDWLKLTDTSYEETLRFVGKGERESKISFTETQDFEFIQNFLKSV